MLRLHVKVMYPIITREGLNESTANYLMVMDVNRTCLVDFFATVKEVSYMYGQSHTHIHTQSRLKSENNQRELISFDQIETLIISE